MAMSRPVRPSLVIALVVGALWLVGVLPASPLTAAQVAHWRFDGDFTDSSGNGNDLSIASGSPTATASPIAPFGTNSAEFDPAGGEDMLKNFSPNNFGFTTSYTIAGWIQAPLPGATRYQGIFWRGPTNLAGNGTGTDIELYIQRDTNDMVLAHNRSNGGTFDFVGFVDPPDDVAFHLAVTFDGANATAFYNGVPQATTQNTTAMSVPLASVNHDIAVGKLDHSLFGPNSMDGFIDELQIFDRVLTQEEIENLILNNATAFIPEPSTLGLVVLGGLFGLRRRSARRRKENRSSADGR